MSYKQLLPLAALPLLLASACTDQAAGDRGGNGDKADSASALDPDQARARIPTASRAVSDSIRTVERSGDQLAYAAGQTPVADLLTQDGGAALPADQELDDFFVGLVADENYEGQGTYLLGPELFCEDGDFVCADEIVSAQLRVFLGVNGDELIIKPMIGPNRVAPLILAASDDGDRLSASIEFDLGATKSAIEHLGSIFEFPVALPQVMAGAGFIEVERIGTAGLSKLSAGLLSDVQIEGADYRISLRQSPSQLGDFVDDAEEALAITIPDDVTEPADVHMHMGDLQLILPWSALGQETSGGMLVEWDGMVLDMVGTDAGPISFRAVPGDSRVVVEVDGVQSEGSVTVQTREVNGTIDGVGVTHPNFPDTTGELVTYRDGFAVTNHVDGASSSHTITADSQMYSIEINEADRAELNAQLAQQTGDSSASGESLECVVSGSYSVSVNGETTTAAPGQCILTLKGDALGTLYVAFTP